MKKIKVYIASSWKNEHGVQLLTELLRSKFDANVISWIEHETDQKAREMPFEDWIHTDSAKKCFAHDIDGAISCDVFIYYAPAGKDAAAELGAAYGAGDGKAIVGLYAKGEDLGIMRQLCNKWFFQTCDLIAWFRIYQINFYEADNFVGVK